MNPGVLNKWVVALLSWVLALAIVVVAYAAWQYTHGRPLQWDVVRDSAIFTAPMALLMAFRDRKG